jgi:hypothetical protein
VKDLEVIPGSVKPKEDNMNLPKPFPGLAVNVNGGVQISQNQNTINFKPKRAGKNGAIIAVVLDESGSMGVCWDATIAGFNEFVTAQRAADSVTGTAALTLIKFDAPQIHTVYADRPLSEVPVLDKNNYRPNGGTNLLDAIGEAMNSVNAALSKHKKADRPGVIITIMTDGAENSSRSFNNEQIKAMVKAAEAKDWTFNFLGANIDAFAVGSTFGMNASNSTSYSTANMTQTMASVSASTTRMRFAKAAGVSTAELYKDGLYTSAELKSMKE